jgi:hypothetical protein
MPNECGLCLVIYHLEASDITCLRTVWGILGVSCMLPLNFNYDLLHISQVCLTTDQGKIIPGNNSPGAIYKEVVGVPLGCLNFFRHSVYESEIVFDYPPG